MVSRFLRVRRPLATVAVLVLGAGLVGGCAARRGDPTTTGSIGLQQSSGLRAQADAMAVRYQANPRDKATILAYARILGLNDRWSEAVAVLQSAVIQGGSDKDISAAYGKALASNGNFEEALKVIRSTNSLTTPDWRLLSAEGAILDQMGQPEQARRVYSTALKIAPDEPTVVNNMALSYLFTNEAPRAEEMLRKAAASPKADARVRQNLALALGLQGKFAEAEQVAQADLPPDQAEENMAYLRAMIGQVNGFKAGKQPPVKTTAAPTAAPSTEATPG